MPVKLSLFASFWCTQAVLCLHFVELFCLLVLIKLLVRLHKNQQKLTFILKSSSIYTSTLSTIIIQYPLIVI